MPKRPAEWAVVLVLLVLAVLVAVLFDSPTSVWLLVGLVFVGVGLSYVGSRRGGRT